MTTKIIIIALLSFPCFLLKAQSNYYRISGQLITVNNDTISGNITFPGDKKCWIDFFKALRVENPYSNHFNTRDQQKNTNKNNPFAHLQPGEFTCRFGDIKRMRLTARNGITLQLKNGQNIKLKKCYQSVIGSPVSIFNGQEHIVKWDFISEINFMPVPLQADQLAEIPVAGIAKSTQGIYKGIINWNYGFPLSIKNEKLLNSQLQQIRQITRHKSKMEIISQNHTPDNDLYVPIEIGVNMPGIGWVVIPRSQLNQLDIIPLEELKLPSYADFKEPKQLKGEVITQNGTSFKGLLAYNLNASFEIETLQGENDGLTYGIPFRYILSIEPKNYKYSFITLRNGSQLSLGDTADVNEANEGVIVFPDNQIPTYIPWEEIQKVIFD